MSCGGDGLTVGDVVGFTFSSQVKNKGGVISRNALVGLFRVITDSNGPESEIPIFVGFMTDFTLQSGILSFSAVDVINFTDNDYTSFISEEESGKEDGLYLPIGEQYKAAKALLTAYSGNEVIIPQTGAANYTTTETGWSIRELFSKCAIFDGKNYYVDHQRSSLTSQTIIAGFGDYTTSSASEHSAVAISSADIEIEMVEVADKDNITPVLEQGVTYEDYGIFQYINGQPTPAKTKKYVCPFINKNNKEICQAKALLSYTNGASFSCNEVLFSSLKNPYTHIHFSELGENQPAFYIMQATYKLSGSGLIASISGTTKSISDSEFIGQTQSDLQKRILLGVNYGYVSVHLKEGIVWDDTGVKEKNSSNEDNNKNDDKTTTKEEKDNG